MCSAFFRIVKGVCVCEIHLYVLVTWRLAVTGSFTDVIDTMGVVLSDVSVEQWLWLNAT